MKGILGKILNTRRKKKELAILEDKKIKELSEKKAYRKFNVSGVTYENRQRLLCRITRKYGLEGVGKIEFIREPDNPHDPNAIKIHFDKIGHIGYVPKEINIKIWELLNKNAYDVKWNVDCFFNEYEENHEGTNYMEIRLYKIQKG